MRTPMTLSCHRRVTINVIAAVAGSTAYPHDWLRSCSETAASRICRDSDHVTRKRTPRKLGVNGIEMKAERAGRRHDTYESAVLTTASGVWVWVWVWACSGRHSKASGFMCRSGVLLMLGGFVCGGWLWWRVSWLVVGWWLVDESDFYLLVGQFEICFENLRAAWSHGVSLATISPIDTARPGNPTKERQWFG